jgi:uncharacterized membrane protein YfcA
MITCATNSDCPPLSFCGSGLSCEHVPLVPASYAVQVISYVLIPIGLSFANAVGISGGFLRVIVLMDLLAYTAEQATYLTYPITFAGGLVNFCLLIFRRQDGGDTLIDYILVLILLPSQVVGVVVGNILTSLIPSIGLDIFTVIFFAALAVSFLIKMIKELKLEKEALILTCAPAMV